jgi:hypothetical protein
VIATPSVGVPFHRTSEYLPGNSNIFPHISSDEQSWIINSGLKPLDANIQHEAVTYAGANDPNLAVKFVDLSGWYGGSDIMSGHRFCSADPWVYGPSINYPNFAQGLPGLPTPMHPTPEGQLAIYRAIGQYAGI